MSPFQSYLVTASAPRLINKLNTDLNPYDITLPPTGIKGQIKNSENSPVIMAKVQIQGSGESTFSDNQGNYLLSGLESSTLEYTVNVSAPGYQQNSKDIQLTQGKVENLSFNLNKPKPNESSNSTRSVE